MADPAEAYAGCVTILEGIKGCPVFSDVTYAPGYTYPQDNEALIQKSLAGDYCFFETNDRLIAQAVTAAKESDVILLVGAVKDRVDGPNEPAYCFGFGKGYTEFSYENLCTDKPEFTFGETISLSVGVKNRGTLDGEAVVQVYLQDVSTSLARPVRQLIAFQKVKVCAGEMKTVAFQLDTNGFGFYKDRRYTLEPGKFLLYAGGDSDARMSLAVTGKGRDEEDTLGCQRACIGPERVRYCISFIETEKQNCEAGTKFATQVNFACIFRGEAI